MKFAIFHGSPRKGNTYTAVKIFMDQLSKCGEAHFQEFFLPEALPAFCTGCTVCFSGLHTKCPNTHYTTPIIDAILKADALIFATPHYGACSMPASMKNLLDHLDFFVLHIDPHKELFSKKAFVISTGAGSTAAVKPIKKVLKHWGINRVYSLGIRLITNAWDAIPQARRERLEKKLRKSAQRFYNAPKRRPHLSTVFHYHISRLLIVKKFIGAGNYPYENWKEKGYFKKRPF